MSFSMCYISATRLKYTFHSFNYADLACCDLDNFLTVLVQSDNPDVFLI